MKEPIEIFKSKVRFSNRGMKIVSQRDRASLVLCLDNLIKSKSLPGLKQILLDVMQRKYHANAPHIEDNVAAYMSANVGIGMSLLVDICSHVGITCVVVVSLPSKDCTLLIYED